MAIRSTSQISVESRVQDPVLGVPESRFYTYRYCTEYYVRQVAELFAMEFYAV